MYMNELATYWFFSLSAALYQYLTGFFFACLFVFNEIVTIFKKSCRCQFGSENAFLPLKKPHWYNESNKPIMWFLYYSKMSPVWFYGINIHLLGELLLFKSYQNPMVHRKLRLRSNIPDCFAWFFFPFLSRFHLADAKCFLQKKTIFLYSVNFLIEENNKWILQLLTWWSEHCCEMLWAIPRLWICFKIVLTNVWLSQNKLSYPDCDPD